MKPCPFCGAIPEYLELSDEVRCVCGICMSRSHWNHRSIDIGLAESLHLEIANCLAEGIELPGSKLNQMFELLDNALCALGGVLVHLLIEKPREHWGWQFELLAQKLLERSIYKNTTLRDQIEAIAKHLEIVCAAVSIPTANRAS